MPMTRRAAFNAAAFAAAYLGSALLPRNANAASQLSKDQVQYRDQPNSGQQCSQCANFLAPGGCRVVSGTVSPQGWCRLYQAKN